MKEEMGGLKSEVLRRGAKARASEEEEEMMENEGEWEAHYIDNEMIVVILASSCEEV
jgi:hypothetical protein